MDDEQGGAPRYLVAFSSIMTLLLAFFIILQSLAPQQSPGLFYAGTGSFIAALETFGLQRFLTSGTMKVIKGKSAPRYTQRGTRERPPEYRRIDVEYEDAQRSLKELERKHRTEQSKDGGSYVVFVTPFSAGDVLAGRIDGAAEDFLRKLAVKTLPPLLLQGCVVGIGGMYSCSDEDELDVSIRARRAAEIVRHRLLSYMDPSLRARAASRVYSFCRRVYTTKEGGKGRMEVRIDVLLTRVPPGNE